MGVMTSIGGERTRPQMIADRSRTVPWERMPIPSLAGQAVMAAQEGRKR